MAKKARIPAAIKNYVFATFGGCVACGSRDATHCGHIVPEAAGGQMIAENFIRLCEFCNTTQGATFVAFSSYADPVSLKMGYGDALTLIQSRRAAWAAYCRTARGVVAVKPYRPIR